MSTISSDVGRFITEEESIAFKSSYQQRKKEQLIPEQDTVRFEYFGSNNIRKILDQSGCVGIRIYHAKRRETINGNEHLVPRVVLVGVDQFGKEILELTDANNSGMKDMPSTRNGELAEGHLCPDRC